jgi:hypothetical protein
MKVILCSAQNTLETLHMLKQYSLSDCGLLGNGTMQSGTLVPPIQTNSLHLLRHFSHTLSFTRIHGVIACKTAVCVFITMQTWKFLLQHKLASQSYDVDKFLKVIFLLLLLQYA